MARRAGVQLRTRCRVREILVDDNDMATGVVYYDENGVEQLQRRKSSCWPATAWHAAAAAQLEVRTVPDGWQPLGLVGKNLMLHPWGMVRGAFDAQLESHLGPQSCCILSQQFYETDRARGFVRGYNMQITRGLDQSRPRAWRGRGDIPWGAGHHEAFAQRYDRTIGSASVARPPEEHNTVTLDPARTDSNGIPAPKVTYRVSENSLRMLSHGLARGTEAMKAAGAWNVHAEGPMRQTGWHQLGTARMGTTPSARWSTSGPQPRREEPVIVDGSVFVTRAASTDATIQAVALYVADAMKRRLANLFD